LMSVRPRPCPSCSPFNYSIHDKTSVPILSARQHSPFLFTLFAPSKLSQLPTATHFHYHHNHAYNYHHRRANNTPPGHLICTIARRPEISKTTPSQNMTSIACISPSITAPFFIM
jgi:hypothetical protein